MIFAQVDPKAFENYGQYLKNPVVPEPASGAFVCTLLVTLWVVLLIRRLRAPGTR